MTSRFPDSQIPDLVHIMDHATKGAFTRAARHASPVRTAIAEATRVDVAMMIGVLVLAFAFVFLPLGCYLFVTYFATEDELDDLETRWWFPLYVRCGRLLRLLPFNGRGTRWLNRTSAQSTERATLLQGSCARVDAAVEGGSSYQHQSDSLTRRRNTSSC